MRERERESEELVEEAYIPKDMQKFLKNPIIALRNFAKYVKKEEKKLWF